MPKFLDPIVYQNGTSQSTAPSDASLSTSDVTTNDVSTSKHGFAPKAPNNTHQFLRGDGGWASPDTFARVTGSDATTTGQALVDITGLSLALLANSTYEFEAVLSCAVSAVTTGNQYGVQFSAAGATIEAQIIGSLTSTATKSERINALNTATTAFLTTSAQNGQVLIKGIIVVGANSGSLSIRHLKVTSGTSTVRVNSFLKVTKIS